ncbi:hypothetical protein [Paenibacillus sp. FSL M8-0142]|uniref:hypothetical protein n=1 Tax=Paenibacillus sp. FSL M8-0142 TaxID=2954525 RepID=UPI00315A4616
MKTAEPNVSGLCYFPVQYKTLSLEKGYGNISLKNGKKPMDLSQEMLIEALGSGKCM